ncbi:MAG: flagellar motor switch protein FliM [Epulopiscium sp.]|nr:flagellar motor switch protein FliM [Candidatus Epulonipiscium sp.]
MAEVLSQSEIDNLLKALDTGELDMEEIQTDSHKQQLKDYDFSRPSKFAKEQLRTLEIIFENYARLLTTYLSGYLRTPIHIEVINAEAVTYSEFTNSLNNPVILGIVDFAPMKGSIIVELSSNIGYSIIDRVLGGSGTGIEKIREFSEIERILLERMIGQWLGLMREPWENVAKIHPRLEKLETNSQFAQIISPNEMIALLTLNIEFGDQEGLLNICIPHIVIEPYMERLNTKYWFTPIEHKDDTEYHLYLETKLETAKIPVQAVLGQTYITVGEFLHLQQGDIIQLDSYVDSDLKIMVGNLFKFKGKPGVHKNKNAIQITDIMREEDY